MVTRRQETVNKPAINIKPLSLARCLEDLDVLVQEQVSLKRIRGNFHKLPPVLNKLKTEIYNCVDDQEKCYLLCRRYIFMVDRLSRQHEDQHYVRTLFSYDRKQVEKLLEDLKLNLQVRYAASNLKYDPPEDPTQPSASKAVQRSRPLPSPRESSSRSVFSGMFIEPAELHSAFESGRNILLVDVRPKKEFQQYRIKNPCSIINIPPELSTSGLSANILGKKLDPPSQEIWQKRDSFDGIVLLDSSTMKFDYSTSKLMFVRDALVDWDCNTKYRQSPVILNGGLEKYVDWYPAEVTNASGYLFANCNKEIDELLDIENVEYPEPGSTSGPGNVKMFSINSVGELESRLYDSNDIILKSISEEQLPADMSEPQDSSQISSVHLPRDSSSSEDTSSESTTVPSREDSTGSPDLKHFIEGDRKSLLKQARALKPRSPLNNASVLDIDKNFEGTGYPVENMSINHPEAEIPSKRSEILPKDSVVRPEVDRTRKPFAHMLREVACPGEGFTALRNIKNNCYMNTMMQSLKVIPVLKSMYVTSNRYILQTIRKPPKINYEFAWAMQDMWRGTKMNPKISSLNDFRLKMVQLIPIYGKGHHEDTFEFFTSLFFHISQDCEYQIDRPAVMTDSQRAWIGNLGGNSSFYNDLFFHQIKNRRVCKNCKKCNFSYDIEGAVMLPTPDTERTLNLQDLIDEHLQECEIADFACKHCKTFDCLIHYKELVLAPDILVIILKRYKSRADGVYVKSNVPVEFPKENLLFGNTRYRLYAIPQHVGSMEFGHYFTTVLLDDLNDAWYKFNDDIIVPVDRNLEAYSLQTDCVGFFYVKQSL